MSQASNGNLNKLLWWVIGTLTTIVLGVGAGTLGQVQSLTHNNRERLSVLEEYRTNVTRQLERIETKLDRLLEKP